MLKWIWPAFLRKPQVEYGPFCWAVIIVLAAGGAWAIMGCGSYVHIAEH